MIRIQEEPMSDHFTKYHLEGLPFDVVIHKFSSVAGENAHCHPYRFTSHVLKGGYIERRYRIHPGGIWTFENIERKAGTSFVVEAEAIHEIIALPEGEAWTVIMPEAKTREPGFWNFTKEGIWFRQWNKSEPERIFEPLEIESVK